MLVRQRLGDLDVVGALPAALVLLVAAVWSWQDGGFASTTWLPGALFVVGLLVTVALASRLHYGSRPLALAVAAFAAFTVWNYLSISWAEERGIAWDGANRTLLYFAIFATVAARAYSARAVAWLVGGYVLALAAILAYWADRATAASDPGAYFILGRLATPIDYPNAQAGLALAAFWPALIFASRRSVPIALRATMLAVAGLLLELSVLSQSRASLVAVPAVAVVFLALVPGRVRALVTLAPVAVVTAVSWHALSHLYTALVETGDDAAALSDARRALARSFAVLLFTGALLGIVDRTVVIPARAVRVFTAALVVLVLAGVGTAAAVGVARYGNPVSRLDEGWRHFKSGRRDDYRRTHLLSGLGSKRYDLWRVAVIEFRRHPLGGIGSDNYAAAYVRERRTNEEPLYPHSLELRLLSQTGIIGTLLFATFLVSAGVAWWRAGRRAAAGERAVSVAAGLVFVYWLVHGSVDWFWEMPALGAAAFAALALAVRVEPSLPEPGNVPAKRGLWLPVVVVLAGVLGAVSLAGPWLSARQVQLAIKEWPTQPARAFDRLSQARRLNPLSEEPDVIAGVIADRLGERETERRAFERAVARNPRDWYAHFELGVVDALEGRKREALQRFAVAGRLNPSEPVIRDVRKRVQRGQHVDQRQIDAEFADRAAILQKKAGQA